MIRRERRQWALIVALLVATVTAGVVLVTAAFNLERRPQAFQGNASHVLAVSSPEETPAILAAAQSTFASVDLLTSGAVKVDGFAAAVEVRSLDPAGLASGALVALREGRYPVAVSEIAGTERQTARLGITVGDQLMISGERRELVGVVENPELLSDQFLLAPQGSFDAELTELLVISTDDQVEAFAAANDQVHVIETRDDRAAAAMITATVVAGVLVEVALLVVAALTLLAQRRIRLLGLLAAVGATKRQLRSAIVAGAVVVGSLSAAAGAALGLLGSSALVPRLETLADRRIATVEYPWIVIVGVTLLAAAATVVAAWWPARRMAQVSVGSALRSRRPSTRPVTKMIVAGALLTMIGAFLVLSYNDSQPIYRYAAGVVAIPVGMVLLAPAAVRMWGWLAPRFGLSGKVAARDITRYQTRSAATVAALIVVLTVPVFIAAGTRVLERSESNVPTMAENQAIVSVDSCSSGDIEGCEAGRVEYEAEVSDLATKLGAQAIRLDEPTIVFEALDEFNRPGVFREPLPAGILQEEDDTGVTVENVPSYLATPELAAALDLDQSLVDTSEVVTNRSGEYVVMDLRADDMGILRPQIQVIDSARFELTPGALLSPTLVNQHGWEVVTTGWLIHAERPISDSDIALLSRQAGARGLSVDVAEAEFSGTSIRRWAFFAAALVALGIIAIISALHRAETAEVDATYQALGAGSGFRRNVHGLTMAMLAALAAALAVPVGLLLQVGFAKDILGADRVWESIPIGFIVAVITVVPIGALILAWVTAAPNRRESSLARPFG